MFLFVRVINLLHLKESLMTRLTETAIEDFAIKLFVRLGYDCIHAPDGDTPLPKLMSGELRVEPDTQGRTYNRANVAD